MARIALTGGAYTARSVIANAQRCLNLYPESNPPPSQPPVPVTQYPTPGLTQLATPPTAGRARCHYRSSLGELFIVIGPSVYYVTPTWTYTLLGTVADRPTPVSMADNGLTIVLVDGSTAGYAINIGTHAWTAIVDAAFYGADRVDFLDTFFIFNRPGTAQFYLSPGNWIPGVPFDALDITAKTGYPDPIQAVIVMHRELWVIGQLKSEVWYDAGAADFAFQAQPGAFVEHGCAAKYSVATQDLSVYWLSRDLQGNGLVMKGNGYQGLRISDHAIENAFLSYSTIEDAIGFCYQQEGHAFYVLIFPTADKTWVFDEATQLWHERAWTDANGADHRIRANCFANAYGKTLVSDWETGALYSWDLTAYTDAGNPIKRLRSWPHMVKDGNRVFYQSFIADIEVGTDDGSVDGSTAAAPPVASLRWSDDRGVSFGNPVTRSIGDGGNYRTSVLVQRLGMARDRVFELSWSVPTKTALNGAFIRTAQAAT